MKRILTYITSALMMASVTSCSDDVFEGPREHMPDDGRLVMRYSVPEMQGVRTRGVNNEDDIKSLTLLIFDKSGSLQQVESVTDLSNASFEVTIDESLRRDGDLKFLMVANADKASPVNDASVKYDYEYFESKKGTLFGNIATLQTALIGMPYGTNDICMVMSGYQTLSDVLAYNQMAMYRSVAKVSVNKTDGTKQNDKYVIGEAVPFEQYGTATSSSIFAGADQNNLSLSNPRASVNVASTVTNDEAQYVHATKNTGTYAGRSFVIVKAKLDGDDTDYYYRLDYQTEDGYINVNPNHWYQFVILDVKGKGYLTPAEAAKNPTPLGDGSIDWEIYDHSPEVYNMVTDGKNYLGVSHDITVDGNVTGANTKTAEFYVRTATKGDGNLASFTASNISTSRSWMEIGSVTPIDDSAVGDKGPVLGNDTHGQLYKVSLIVKSYTEPGSQTGVVTVNWHGLSREIPVYWNRDFDASTLIRNAKLEVYNGAGQLQSAWTQNDYFSFLEGESGTAATKVYGVKADENNGNPRDEGFHFPLAYGEDTPWKYKYTVTFENQTDQNYKWRFSVDESSDQVVKDNLKITVNSANVGGVVTTRRTDATGPVIVLEFDNSDQTPGIGALSVEVAPDGTEDWSAMPVDVYYTGFFHRHDSNTFDHAVQGSYDTGALYYYYGVLRAGSDLWLDRNMGATSAEEYVERTGGTAQQGSSKGAGAYYYVANQKNRKPDFYVNICPPGYQIPYANDFDVMRKRVNFHQADLGGYATCYYVSESTVGGKRIPMYFSKALYYDKDNKLGESRTGYYWTRTTATGFEKDEIGRWLRGFVISGVSNYQNNSRIDYQGAGSGFAMSVRAVRNHPEPSTSNEVRFFVKGATHVFLYSLDTNGKPVPAAPWPGISVSNFETADKGYMNFTYNTNTSADKVFVIFNYKASNGQITSVSKSGEKSMATTSLRPDNLQGWQVSGDLAPNGGTPGLVTQTGTTISLSTTGINTATTRYYWTIDRTPLVGNQTYLTNVPLYIAPTVNIVYELKGPILGSWDDSDNRRFEETSPGVYELTATVTAGEFGIRELHDGKEMGFWRSGGTVPTNGTEVQFSTSGGNSSLQQGGTYKFTFDSTTHKLIVVGEQTQEPISGYAFGIRGLLWGQSGDSWSTKIMTETSSGSGIWELKNVQVYANRDFGIGGYTKNSDYQNDTNQKVWYETSSGNATVKNGVSKTLQSSSGAKLQMEESGIYDFTFNEITKEFIATKHVTGDPTDNMYLVGTHNDWTANNDSKMYTTDGITYTITVPNMGTNNFKFNGGAWGTREFGSGTGDPLVDNTYPLTGKDGDFHLKEGGNVTFTLVKTDSNWATCNVTIKHN